MIVSPDTEAFFREGLSEEKDGPVRGGGVEGPDTVEVEDLSRSGDLTGKRPTFTLRVGNELM